MTDAVTYEQFEEVGQSAPQAQSDADLRRLSDVPMEASVEIGRTMMTVGETLELHPGAIVVLDRLAGEPVDLMVNGTLIARGEVVVIDEQFGVRVSEIVEGDPTVTPQLAVDGAVSFNGHEAPVEAEVISDAQLVDAPEATASDDTEQPSDPSEDQ
jgi:flagellar motor switch protein FliN